MPKPVIFDDHADGEVTEAYLWYLQRSERAANRFLDAMDIAVEQIRERPESFPTYLVDTQVCQLRKFPYLVVFRNYVDRIYVVAVAHGHRRPGYWAGRF